MKSRQHVPGLGSETESAELQKEIPVVKRSRLRIVGYFGLFALTPRSPLRFPQLGCSVEAIEE